MKTYENLMASNLKLVNEYPEKFHISSPEKISLKAKNSFSLPAGPKYACPGATKACDGCYAAKGRHFFPNVQKAFGNNWKLIRKLQRNKAPEKATRLLLEGISAKQTIFRIHESGDFHSQWYLDRWTEVVRNRRDVMFWAYTRSFELNFQKLVRQPNVVLWASTDEYNIKEATAFVKRYTNSDVKHAYGPWKHQKELPPNSFVCPVTNGKMELKGSCERCELCIIKKRTNKNVVFLEH